MADERLEIVRRAALFSDSKLEEAAIEEVARSLVPRVVRAGSPIFREGDSAAAMFLIAQGRVGIFKRAGDSRLLLAELGAGACFGEMALVDGGTRSADADALEDAELLALDAVKFDEIIDRFPRLALGLLRATSKRLRSASSQAAVEAEDDDVDPIVARYPHPIAAVYRHLAVLVDPRPRLERFFDLLEVVTRYLTAVTLSAYRAGGRPVEPVDEVLVNGAQRLTLGSALTVCAQAVQRFDGSPEGLFLPDLHGFFWVRAGRRSEAAKQLLALIDVRNKVRHTAGGALSDRDAQKRVDDHLPELRVILERLSFLAANPLLWLEKMDFTKGTFVYRAQRCMGSHADFESETFSAKVPYETGHLHLRRASDDALLSLHPLLHVDTCGVCGSREVFFLHGAQGTSVEYAEFVRGHHHATEAVWDSYGAMQAEARDRLREAERAG